MKPGLQTTALNRYVGIDVRNEEDGKVRTLAWVSKWMMILFCRGANSEEGGFQREQIWGWRGEQMSPVLS